MNKNCENCWEYNNCSDEEKVQCEAHKKDMGKECWMIPDFTGRNQQEKGMSKCFSCGWYRKLKEEMSI